jgi:TRAP-type C4-dicarboxylate transport system permease small subunit
MNESTSNPSAVVPEPGTQAARRLKSLTSVLAGLGALIVLSIALIINSDILSRFIFDHPLMGVAELVELGIVVVVFIQLPYAISSGALIRSGELHEVISRRAPRIGWAMAVFFDLAGAFVLALLTYGLWPDLIAAWQDNLFKGQPGMFTAPLWPAMLATVLGTGIGALVFASSALRRITSRGNL